MKAILDQLPEIERQAPAVAGRMDHARIGAVGYSFGGHTVGLLLGAQVNGEDFSDPRISAGVLLTTPGRGGKDDANTTTSYLCLERMRPPSP